MKRTCTKCGETKPIEDYYVRPRQRGGRATQCKRCEIATAGVRNSQPEVRARRNELARKRARPVEQTYVQRLWTWHRLRPEQFEQFLAAQGGRCGICRKPEPGGMGRWHVDHDHACCPTPKSCGGCVRGLLCARCNPMIGMAKDDPAILLAAADYLSRRSLPTH